MVWWTRWSYHHWCNKSSWFTRSGIASTGSIRSRAQIFAARSVLFLTITSIIIFRLDRTARRSILSIHTSSWSDDSRLSADVLDWLIEQTSGYCGSQSMCMPFSDRYSIILYLRNYAPKPYWSHCVVNIRKSIWATISINSMWMLYAYNVLTLSIRKIVPTSRRGIWLFMYFLFVIHFFKDMRIVSRPLSQRTRPLLISLIENIMKGLSLFTFSKIQMYNCFQNESRPDMLSVRHRTIPLDNNRNCPKWCHCWSDRL